MRNRWSYSVLALSAVVAFSAQAGVRHYVAELDNSQWQLTRNSPLQCELQHQIPRYGRVHFVSDAGKQLDLKMQMDMRQLPDSYGVAAVQSLAPRWWPGEQGYAIGDMRLYKQFNSELPKQLAWTVLSELEKGRYPTFFYQDWYNERDQVAIGLSAANFKASYDTFMSCVNNLLKFSFEDIAYSVLNYESGGDELTNGSKRKLAQIGQYLQADKDLQLVLIDAYTDSYGSHSVNQKLSEQRAAKIREFFIAMGIDADRIRSEGHGESRHVAANDNSLERRKNRRVVIQLSKPLDVAL
ncbi:flagellar protein MotY [Idiomarina xiamenensis]|uniref:Sodium-type flagellar protein motY n=1 Tax=Idiomarina xiamenensis 10-D-4 TaxID=740709 RepID=K2J9I9_9GAMM|nr:OmpA family protein [Idiomarina xiamenensis]EKE79911.1 Sodium-type flagellar protein motY precursor [Idiomarina xiamenensis 10-D-4]